MAYFMAVYCDRFITFEKIPHTDMQINRQTHAKTKHTILIYTKLTCKAHKKNKKLLRRGLNG